MILVLFEYTVRLKMIKYMYKQLAEIMQYALNSVQFGLCCWCVLFRSKYSFSIILPETN